MPPHNATAGLQVRRVSADDPLLAPMLAELTREYTERYPDFDIAGEMASHTVADFAPPDGAFLVLVDGEEVVAGGAYSRRDPATAELKRVWTSSAHRRRGLAGRLVAALEEHARGAGYQRVFLTTGPRQPEARALYLSLGYRPLGDHDEIVRTASAVLAFDKPLGPDPAETDGAETPDAPAALDPLALRRAFGCFPTGVAAVAAVVDGGPVGMAIGSFTSVSLDPPLAAICVARTSTTWPVLRSSPRLGVSVLSQDQHVAGRRLSARVDDRFAGLDWHEVHGQALLLRDAAAVLETRVHREIDAGDHVLVLLEVLAVDPSPDVPPLVFHASAFRRLEAT